MTKYIGIIVTIGLTIAGVIFGYGKLQEKTDNTEKKVEKHEERIEKMQEIDMRQTIMLEKNTMLIDKIEKRF